MGDEYYDYGYSYVAKHKNNGYIRVENFGKGDRYSYYTAPWYEWEGDNYASSEIDIEEVRSIQDALYEKEKKREEEISYMVSNYGMSRDEAFNMLEPFWTREGR